MATEETEAIEDWREGVAKAIRTLRKAKQIKQLTLSQRTGIHQSTLSKIERTGYPLSFESLYKIAFGLGVSTHDLIPASSEDLTADLK